MQRGYPAPDELKRGHSELAAQLEGDPVRESSLLATTDLTERCSILTFFDIAVTMRLLWRQRRQKVAI